MLTRSIITLRFFDTLLKQVFLATSHVMADTEDSSRFLQIF